MIDTLLPVFASLNDHEVKYLVFGGVASVLYGVPRATFDLDLLIEPTRENAGRLLAALEKAGFGTASLTNPDDLLAHDITKFRDWVQIDVMTAAPGIEFASAWENRNLLTRRGQEFPIVSREDLLAAKKAAGRAKDLEDVRILELDRDKRQS